MFHVQCLPDVNPLNVCDYFYNFWRIVTKNPIPGGIQKLRELTER